MNLPITDNDLDTIVKALALGGDTRLYFLLKNFKEDRIISMKQETSSVDSNVKIYSESDDYQCKHGTCDI
tara:strand:- start:287 stop:496 length:210 start_codon:yes stop_codon:yes gene_type:complete